MPSESYVIARNCHWLGANAVKVEIGATLVKGVGQISNDGNHGAVVVCDIIKHMTWSKNY